MGRDLLRVESAEVLRPARDGKVVTVQTYRAPRLVKGAVLWSIDWFCSASSLQDIQDARMRAPSPDAATPQ